MKEAYEAPEITRIHLAAVDLLATSTGEDDNMGEWDFENQQDPGFIIML